MAGGGSGGDIIFHELCYQLNIPSEIYLAMSVNDYKNESVSYAGRKWEERFCSLIQRLPVHVLSRSSDKGNNKHIWEKTNSWMLNIALGNNSQNATLIALWDGKGGDGKGGTEHMVHIAKKMDVNVEIMDINRIG